MSNIPDFNDAELDVIKQTLQERFKKDVETKLADIELRLDPGDRELTECPAIFWEYGDCNFIIAKTGNSQFYSQFYYGSDHFGTGIKFYDDIVDCVVTLLQVQSDHELEKGNVKSLNK